MCGRVLEHKQRPAARTRDTTYEFCRRHRSLSALLAQRMKILSMFSSLEYLNPVLTFTALAAHISVLMLYDFIESNPLGTEAQAAQLTMALHTEHQQQSLDAVADTATLVAVLGQHFQVCIHTHPNPYQANVGLAIDTSSYSNTSFCRRQVCSRSSRSQRCLQQTHAVYCDHITNFSRVESNGS